MNPEAARPTEAELRRLSQVFEDVQRVLEALAGAGHDTSDAWVDVLAAHDAYKAAIRASVLA